MSTTVVVQDAGLRLPFTAVELTQSINTLPPQFGQMARDGMFPIEPLASAYIEIVSEGGAIYALPITDEGRPATIARRDKGQSLIFKIPNITHEDSVLANDIRNWLAAAQRTRLVAGAQAVQGCRGAGHPAGPASRAPPSHHRRPPHLPL